MKNNSPLTSSTGTTGKSTIALALFALSCAAYLVIINIIGKIGLTEFGMVAMVLAIVLAVFIFTILASRISSTSGLPGMYRFQKADSNTSIAANAMAGASEWLSLFFIIGLISSLTTNNHDGLALIMGTFAGIAFATIFIVPKLRQHELVSVVGAITSRINGGALSLRLARWLVTAIIIVCAFLFLIAQIGTSAQILQLHFSMPAHWAAFCVLLPVLLALLAGGMSSATIANMLLYLVISCAVILPALWLSQRITGNPFPQFSFGDGALQPILQLERQLAENIANPAAAQFGPDNFGPLTGAMDFYMTFFMMMAGSAGLPLLFGRAACSPNPGERVRSMAWTLLLVAFIISFIPAMMTFMKFEIYRDLVGLPISQLGASANWLFHWAEFEIGQHALVCGKPALDIAALISACNDGPNHILLPSDLQFSPLMTFLGAAEIADMPRVYSAIAYTGILSAAASTIAIALIVITNVINSEIFPEKLQSSNPVALRLFIARAIMIVAALAGIGVALSVRVPVTDFTLWGFALSAGVIFPALAMSLWWSKSTALGTIMGILSGLLMTSYLLLTIEYGADWIAQNGDEPVWRLPFSDDTLKPANAAIIGFPITLIAITLVTKIELAISRLRQKTN